jgi:type IX secretion system PorP/SprF family membrane protein
MSKKVIISSILALAWSINSHAQQDKHLSMWNENAAQINPGAAGAMSEDIRLLTNFRLQWLPLNGEGFRTNTFSFDAKLFKNKTTGSHMGVGLNFVNDATGDNRMTSNIISVPIAYTVGLDKQSFLSIGIAPGFYSQSLGSGNQTWNNQWDGSTFNAATNSLESSTYQNSVSALDIGAGMQFKYNFDGSSHIQLGASVNHITQPNLGYTSLNTTIYRNANFYVSGTKFNPERRFGISPQALISLYGPNANVIFGTYFDHELFESSQRTDYVQRSMISYGVFYRWKDAVAISLACKFLGFKLGVSYDLNISTLNTATNSMGGLEFFLKYSMMADKTAYIHDRRLFRWRGGRGRL